ncbi:hypothetical protein IAQ61_010243 [Plenodomus lingam]|uniref:uncharacterized protein n=1 Tax=Leptosphaeria maculans TaxID=5022 RepID=UPI00332B44F7|nr:hypothetical protein IAQ61_010243 [Plenodomus lingam]
MLTSRSFYAYYPMCFQIPWCTLVKLLKDYYTAKLQAQITTSPIPFYKFQIDKHICITSASHLHQILTPNETPNPHPHHELPQKNLSQPKTPRPTNPSLPNSLYPQPTCPNTLTKPTPHIQPPIPHPLNRNPPLSTPTPTFTSPSSHPTTNLDRDYPTPHLFRPPHRLDRSKRHDNAANGCGDNIKEYTYQLHFYSDFNHTITSQAHNPPCTPRNKLASRTSPRALQQVSASSCSTKQASTTPNLPKAKLSPAPTNPALIPSISNPSHPPLPSISPPTSNKPGLLPHQHNSTLHTNGTAATKFSPTALAAYHSRALKVSLLRRGCLRRNPSK